MAAHLHDVLHISTVAALLVACVAPKDALCLIVAAVECDLHDGARQLLTHVNSATLRTEEDDDGEASLVLHCAAAFGCRRAVQRLLQCGGVYAYVAVESPPPLSNRPLEESLRQSQVAFPAEVLYRAAARGDCETITWQASATVYNPHKAMLSAAVGGHVDVAYWLSTMERQAPDADYQWLLDDEGNVLCGQWPSGNGVVFASRDDGVIVLKTQQDDMTKGEYACAMDFVAGCGDLELLKRMHHDPRTSWPCTCKAMVVAATHGHLDVLQWLVESRTELLVDSDEWIVSAADSAARNGHLAVLGWLPYKPAASAFVAALEGGHIQVLQWIRDSGGVDPWSLPGLPSRVALMEAACVSANRLGVLRWLEQTTNIRTVTATAMSYVIGQGDVRTAQWLADPMGDGDNLSHWNWVVAKWMSYEFALWHNATITKAALNGHIAIVRWLVQAGPLHKVEVDTLWRCARSGHLDVVAFLLKNPSHLPKGVQFLPAHWTSFHDSVDENLAAERAGWTWHRGAYDPVWVRSYVELWLAYDAQACRRVPWLHEWAVHTGNVNLQLQLGVSI